MSGLVNEPLLYELVITGSLGPVLRSALAPYASAAGEVHTIIRARIPAGGDLVDLFDALASRGLEVVDIVEDD